MITAMRPPHRLRAGPGVDASALVTAFRAQIGRSPTAGGHMSQAEERRMLGIEFAAINGRGAGKFSPTSRAMNCW